MRPLLAALLIGAGVTTSSLHAQPAEDSDKVRQVIVYGKDPCPRSSNEEIIVCSRRPESERLRLPPNMRDSASPERESEARKKERLNEAGRTGVGSCSAVGPGSGTGCLLEQIQAAKEERDAAAAEGTQPQ